MRGDLFGGSRKFLAVGGGGAVPPFHPPLVKKPCLVHIPGMQARYDSSFKLCLIMCDFKFDYKVVTYFKFPLYKGTIDFL